MQVQLPWFQTDCCRRAPRLRLATHMSFASPMGVSGNRDTGGTARMYGSYERMFRGFTGVPRLDSEFENQKHPHPGFVPGFAIHAHGLLPVTGQRASETSGYPAFFAITTPTPTGTTTTTSQQGFLVHHEPTIPSFNNSRAGLKRSIIKSEFAGQPWQASGSAAKQKFCSYGHL